MQAASLIHDEREQDHLVRLAAGLGEQSTSPANLERLAARAAAGQDPHARFGPNGLEAAIAEVGAALTVPAARAREFIEAGSVLRHQLPFIGATLGAGRIDLPRFLAVVRRTALCTPEKLDLLDKIIAADIETREPMSMVRFLVMIDKHIATHDPAATRRRRELVDSERNISVRPDRHTPGQSRIGGSLPAEQAAAVDARLTAMAAAVHADDPRTAAQRRADALVGLAHGANALDCRCETCTSDPDAGGIDADPATVAAPSDTARSDGSPDATESPCAPRPTFHIVVNLSSLLGLDDDPAFLDGQGILDADTARRLVAGARRTYIRPDVVAEPRRIDRYAPSKMLADQVRAGELCCSFPGCNNRAFHTDVDHDIPFAQGGPTNPRNLKPLCRFHHRIKTFAVGWRDYHDPLGEVFFQSPAGHTYLGNAFTGRDVFGSLTRTGRPPDDAARQRIDTVRARRAASIKRADQRAMDRWNAENPPPF
ncbi:HNH endonuclease signature motif containing protein [Gordonia hankookensis]|uniref:DUF222 domain-containing protein n=1 Tax=Gordonia hankookensis TaxID=589403 RepID=A0ABR7WC61_9ACTN|nr:HNH endonuclease signature motif containing protein [Gordonia hankookensis]MBD1320391.1 DUF222 domain-containing protein [Gordonia hankookensis]